MAVELKESFTMTCHNCRTECRKFGKRGTRQRNQCNQCHKVFTDARDQTLDGMYLPVEKAEMVLRLLLEGNSVSSVERATEVPVRRCELCAVSETSLLAGIVVFLATCRLRSSKKEGFSMTPA
jgi:hypothetical protein